MLPTCCLQMDDLVATFSTLARVEEHRVARAAQQAEAPAPHPEATPGEPTQPDIIRALFGRIDSNGDGR